MFEISICIFLWWQSDGVINRHGAGSVIVARLNWICWLLLDHNSRLNLFTLSVFSISPFPFPHHSSNVSPYIKPGSAATEPAKCRHNCQMDRWGLPWSTAKTQILAVAQTHIQNKQITVIICYLKWLLNHRKQFIWQSFSMQIIQQCSVCQQSFVTSAPT